MSRVTRDPSRGQRTKVKVTRPLWVAVRVTSCRGRWHIVAVALQAGQIVCLFVCLFIYLFIHSFRHK